MLIGVTSSWAVNVTISRRTVTALERERDGLRLLGMRNLRSAEAFLRDLRQFFLAQKKIHSPKAETRSKRILAKKTLACKRGKKKCLSN